MFQIMRRGEVRLAMMVVCLALTGVVTMEPVESAAVLVSQWKLNEGSGTSTIDSAANRSGTLRNGVAWISGRTGGAVNMDGVDDYVSLPALEVTGQAFTIAAWVRNTSFPSGVSQQFVAKGTDSSEQNTYWMLGQTNSGGQNRLRFRIKTGSQTTTLVASSGNLPVNTWYHAAAIYDGKMLHLYLNGDEVGSVKKTGWLSRGTGVAVNIGRSPEGSSYMRGAIDDVRIYNTALTRWEISQVITAAGSGGTPVNQLPAVSLTAPANGASIAAGTTVSITATATDSDGTVSNVKFYIGSALLGTDTSSPYSAPWVNVGVGSYTLKAVATDNAGATKESTTRTVTVTSPTSPPPPPPPSNQPPSVSLTAPLVSTVFTAPAAIPLTATASDPDGSVARVEFYNGTTRLATDTSSPYGWSWPSVAAGTYSLKAVAFDNAGGMTSSSTRDITVRPANFPSTAIFTPSTNHLTAVTRYVLEVFPAGADTRVANPVATRDLGKPAISNSEIRVDVASTILGLSAGNYVATVTAFGTQGSSQSAASPQFTR